jgi:sarcosine oxidase, subunit beta
MTRPAYDAIIIGAGVIGCATALELARKGRRTLNLDALPAAGYGSTSASAACIRVYYSTLAGAGLAYEGYHYWRRWADHLEAPAGEDLARFVETGSVVTRTEANAHLRPVLAIMDRLGIAYEAWDAGRLTREFPFLDPTAYAPPRRPDDPAFGEAAGPLAGAVFFPNAGYVTDPQLAARNLQRAAERRGAAFRFHNKVAAVRQAGGRVAGVTLADGATVDAPVVVNVAGPHSGVLNRMAGVEAEMTVRTRPMKQEVAHVPAPPGADFARRGFLCADPDIGCYMRSEVGGRLLIGGLEPACDPPEWVDDPDDWDRSLTEQWTAQVYRAALRIPTLPIPGQAQGIAALYDVADDWIPVYDRSSLPGWYMAVGTSGNQFKNAPLAGLLMAELVEACEAGRDHDREPVRVRGPHTGFEIDTGAFSRLRGLNRDSSFTVLG